ncbi:MAG: ABC transporter permease [Chloroflexi bacterium]|nr:ABC transporter permease [Chloroflexota bacterium]
MSVAAAEPLATAPASTSVRPQSTLWGDAVRRFSQNKLAVVSLAIVGVFVLIAILADVISPARYDYSVLSEANQFPNSHHWLGTDAVGRDFLSRLIYGARVSLAVGFSVQFIALAIGLTLGVFAGTFSGWVDYLVMRLVEVFTALPIWLFALFLISVWRSSDQMTGGGFLNVVIAIGLVSWIQICRLTRAQFLTLREKEYVLAATAMGATRMQIAHRHLLPNAVGPLIVVVTLGVPTAIFTEAGLSFLGFGINDPLPSWGKMIADSLAYVRVYWYLALFPTILLALSMLSFSFVGDGLRDALDPRYSR